MGRSEAGNVVSAEIVSVRMDGRPSCVHAAEILLTYRDESTETIEIEYGPNGIMYEVLEDAVRMLTRRFGGR